MSAFKLTEQLSENYLAMGDITFASLGKSTLHSFDFLKSENKVCIDLKDIILADSAGLALVIEWMKYSRKYNTILTLKNVPRQLIRLAKLSGLDLESYVVNESF